MIIRQKSLQIWLFRQTTKKNCLPFYFVNNIIPQNLKLRSHSIKSCDKHLVLACIEHLYPRERHSAKWENDPVLWELKKLLQRSQLKKEIMQITFNFIITYTTTPIWNLRKLWLHIKEQRRDLIKKWKIPKYRIVNCRFLFFYLKQVNNIEIFKKNLVYLIYCWFWTHFYIICGIVLIVPLYIITI